jgi:hypothetical protein
MASTLAEYIASQEELVKEAALALPHQFSQCTHSLGSLRFVSLNIHPYGAAELLYQKAGCISMPNMSGGARIVCSMFNSVPY